MGGPKNMQAGGLTLARAAAMGGNMKTTIPLALALAAAALLGGCNKEDHTIVSGPPGSDEDTANATQVALPPSISESKIYRCGDNKVVYVDWLSDNKSANLRVEPGGVPTQVTAAEAGGAMTGPEGYSLSGTAAAASVKIAVPGHPAQSCKA